jgi:DNA-directed RNA polymerase specialized sigma subunit
MAAAAARPASLEQYMTLPDSAVVIEPADERADIESAGGAGELVRAAMTAIRALPLRHQQVLALHFYGGMELPEVAELLEAGSREVSKIHDEAVAAVHGAMARSASGLA